MLRIEGGNHPAGSYSDISTKFEHKANEVGFVQQEIDFRRVDTVFMYRSITEGGLGWSGNTIEKIAGVRRKTVYDRVRAAGEEVRPVLSDPKLEHNRIEAIKNNYRDPVRKRKIIEIVHSPKNIAKRRATLISKLTDTVYLENRKRARMQRSGGK